MRVLGIDCGGEYTGYGIVEQHLDGRLQSIVCGAIKLRTKEPLATRLRIVFTELCQLAALHRPEAVAIEEVFYSVNPKSALKLGQVRGVAMLAAATCDLPVFEYAALSIKSAVTGYGRAEKHQVQDMVTRLLRLEQIPQPADAADALAIAICHLHTWATLSRQADSQ